MKFMSGTYSPSSKILLLFFAKLWLASVNKSLQKTPPKKKIIVNQDVFVRRKIQRKIQL